MPALAQQEEEEKTSFYLQGFQEEKKMCVSLSNDMSLQQMKDHVVEHGNLQTLLECPLGVTYFHKFLSAEMNVENLQCYMDLKALLDYMKFAKKCPLFDIEKVNELEEQIEEKIEREYAHEHSLEQQLESIVEQEQQEVVEQREEQTRINRSSNLTGERMEKHGDEVLKKSSNFIQKYIDESAIAEVNIDSKTRREVKESFQKVIKTRDALLAAKKELPSQDEATMRNSETIMKIASEMKQGVTDVEETLDRLRTVLLQNLADPLARFKYSSDIDECLSLFLTTEDRNFHRDRLLSADKGGVVLNLDLAWPTDSSARSPLTVVSEMLREARILLSMEEIWTWDSDLEFLQLEYAKLSQIKYWRKIRDMAGELTIVDLKALVSDEEKLTFWINLFNFMMLHAVITAEGIPLVELSRQLFYRKTKYNVGGFEFSLEDIREGIVFGNRGKNLVLGKQFKKNDPRKQFIVQKPIVNSLFALSCFRLQSPKVQTLEVESIYQQLDSATREYLDNVMSLDEYKNVVLPDHLIQRKLFFKLFADDPETVTKNQTETVINFVKRYASHFQKEEHKNDMIVFKSNNSLVTNLSVILTDKDKAVLEKKKRVSAPPKKQEQKKTQETGAVEAATMKKCSWSSGLTKSLKRISFKKKQKKITAVPSSTATVDQKKCAVM
jgi:hypothetical protein